MKSKIKYLVVQLILCLSIANAFSQDIGATFCWHKNEIYGGHRDYPVNKSIVTDNLPSNTNPEWSGMTQWWENMAEEIDYSGLDFVALLSRGNQPNAPDRGNGNPKHISKLVNAMDARGANSFKLAIFDDCPNSWTGSKNWNESEGQNYNTTLNKFNCADVANYKYIWDYNLKQAIEAIPEAKRYKINGRMVLFFWSAKSAWMTNLQTNLSKILQHIRTKCLATFGFTPYIIIDKDWLDSDSTLNSTTVDAVHGWFSVGGNKSYTLETWNGIKTGSLCPSFVKPSETNDFLNPSMGTTDNGKRLKTGLDATVKAGARTTLVEGFTDSAEGAALWRSNDNTYYDYPNQRLNILRKYSSNPYPEILKLEAETCDLYFDLSNGNSGGTFLKKGNLDVAKCNDTYGGWFVDNTQPNEWLEWKEVPLLKSTLFQLRYKSNGATSIKITVDGVPLPTKSLPTTNGSWSVIDVSTYETGSNSLHTVRVTVVSGTPDINYLLRKNGIINVSSIAITPATINILDGNTFQLSAQVLPNNATNKKIMWSSNNSNIATVSAQGLVTAISPGTVTIIATTEGSEIKDTSVVIVTSTATSYSQTLQAENAQYRGATFASNQSGFKGTGFVDFTDDFGGYIAFTVYAPVAGSYNLNFRYALLNGSRPLQLQVNGSIKVSSLNFTETGQWSQWNEIITKQNLSAGVNTIKLTTIGLKGANIDQLKIYPVNRFLDDCDVITNWSSTAGNIIFSNNTNIKQGLGSVFMSGNGTNEFIKVFAQPFISDQTIANGALSFWYYISNASKAESVTVELGSGRSADKNELSWKLDNLQNGWNKIVLNTTDANKTGTINMDAINWFRVYSYKSANITTGIDAISIIDATTNRSAASILNTNSATKAIPEPEKSVVCYPNPFKNGILNMAIKGFEIEKNVNLKIINQLGQIIFSQLLIDQHNFQINMDNQLNDSLYFIVIESENNKLIKKLLVN
jgi:hypothetical protein